MVFGGLTLTQAELKRRAPTARPGRGARRAVAGRRARST